MCYALFSCFKIYYSKILSTNKQANFFSAVSICNSIQFVFSRKIIFLSHFFLLPFLSSSLFARSLCFSLILFVPALIFTRLVEKSTRVQRDTWHQEKRERDQMLFHNTENELGERTSKKGRRGGTNGFCQIYLFHRCSNYSKWMKRQRFLHGGISVFKNLMERSIVLLSFAVP